LVFNKIDQNYNPENFLHLQKESFCYVSAKTGYGVNSLKKQISDKFFENYKSISLELSLNQNEIRASIYDNCNVIDETFAKSGHSNIKFMASEGYIKYLKKKGVIKRNLQKKLKNSQEFYQTG
jgi:50S ribosomal subunit-associated GTPase HflX